MIYSKKAKLTFSLLKSATHVDTTVGYLVKTTRLYRNYQLRLKVYLPVWRVPSPWGRVRVGANFLINNAQQLAT